MLTNHESISDIIFSPTKRADIGQTYLKNRRENKGTGIPLHLTGIDYSSGGKFIPAERGDMTSVIARPGHGKTGFMLRWAREHAKSIKDTNHAVIYITRETPVEHLQSFLIAADTRDNLRKTKTKMIMGEITDNEWDSLMTVNHDTSLYPLWIIGHSLDRKAKRPRLTPEILQTALQSIQKEYSDTTEIDLIFFDYLQRFEASRSMDSLRAAFMMWVDTFKDFATEFNCHTVQGVQAKREVEERKLPIPMMNDGAETSNIEQSSQNVFSLVRPIVYVKEGESFGDKNMSVKKNHLLLTNIKQTNGETNWHKWLDFEPEYNWLDRMEEKSFDVKDFTV